ncbi:MAG: DEAD/DEAH box helicase [Chloroflexi bacterium]|nr:MAG: DEAD/DEAH box helicase [Chloroflexota bacterium]
MSRIVGALIGAPSEPRTKVLLDTEVDAEPDRRSRGRRGGRGRGTNSGSAPASDSRERDNRDGNRDNRDNRDGNRDNRGGRSNAPTRWTRPSRDTLDAPLPEDIAFRPASEGGDASILPTHRRPPPGARRPGRVFYAGTSNQYVTRDDAIGPPPDMDDDEQLMPEALQGAPLDDETAGEGAEGGEQRRRRRGRRGGRGRRRPGEGGEAGSEETADSNDPSGALAMGRPSGDGEYADEDDLDSDELDADDELEVDEDLDDAAIVAAVAEVEAADDYEPEAEVTRERAPQRGAFTPRASSELPEAFRALGLSEDVLQIVAHFGFEQPTPIQQQSIPVLLNGRDVVGIAQTGTGKTLAFGLPMMQRLDASTAAVQGLVLVPTRELASQVLDVLHDFGAPLGFDAVGLLGGRSLDRDFRALDRRPHIVVGTPGRILDHLQRGTLSLQHVRYAVLDEADQMLDIGFLPAITRILSRTPRARQTALFSATMPHAILRLVRRYMESPETVAIEPELTSADTVEQIYFEVAQRDKLHGLHELIERELKGRTLVFSRTRRGVDFVAEQLGNAGVRVGALHGDMDQRRRDQTVQRFRDGQLDILIATNVAARGLDIPEITHVVNYDVPQNPEEYVHRIGRTGRAGREGKAITFVCERDIAEFDVLLGAFGDRLRKEDLRLYE